MRSPLRVMWRVRDLAAKADVTAATISRFETEKTRGYADTVNKLQKTFEDAGIEFLPENGGGPGVRLKKGRG